MLIFPVMPFLFAVTLYHIVRLRRQIQTLKYCWLDMSDAYARFTEVALESAIQSIEDVACMKAPMAGGRTFKPKDSVGDVVSQGTEEWERLVDHHFSIFKRQRIRAEPICWLELELVGPVGFEPTTNGL